MDIIFNYKFNGGDYFYDVEAIESFYYIYEFYIEYNQINVKFKMSNPNECSYLLNVFGVENKIQLKEFIYIKESFFYEWIIEIKSQKYYIEHNPEKIFSDTYDNNFGSIIFIKWFFENINVSNCEIMDKFYDLETLLFFKNFGKIESDILKLSKKVYNYRFWILRHFFCKDISKIILLNK
jgi:hypothetical protein